VRGTLHYSTTTSRCGVQGDAAQRVEVRRELERALIERTCFSVEPGIYLPRRFGVRSELDMAIANGRAEISGAPAQEEIIPLLSRFPN